MENETEQQPQWAVVELMGHVRYGGLVSKDNQYGTAMLRVDVPQPDGSFVTQLVNPASIYRITFCEEKIARGAAHQGDARPISQWELQSAGVIPRPQLVPQTREDDAVFEAGDKQDCPF